MSGSVTLDGTPGFPPVADAVTDTVYVPIQCQNPATNASCNQPASHVLDLIDSANCTARAATGCQVVATAAAGTGPITATIDRRTDTIFVGDAQDGGVAGGAVTVVDGATCNVSVTSGCATAIATIKLGSAFPAALSLDPATGTLYVADANGNVDVVDVSHCNATSTASCGAPVKAIADNLGPVGVAVDTATDTVYAANGADEVSSDTVSVIDGATCNAGQSVGCGQTPTTVTVGTSPQWDVVDQATNTVYVANAFSGSVSLINGAACNGTDTSGCEQTPPAVLTGTGDSYIELDNSRHTLFALNQENDTMSEINVHSCTAQTASLCPIEARNEQVTYNPSTGGPANAFAIAGGGDTAYVVNAGGASLLQPMSIGRCNARDAAGCRLEAPHDNSPGSVSIIGAEGCNGSNPSGCAQSWPTVAIGRQPQQLALDTATGDVYAADAGSAGVSVIDGRTCNASTTSGCVSPAPWIPSTGGPSTLAVDPWTDTVYTGDDIGDAVCCGGTPSFGVFKGQP